MSQNQNSNLFKFIDFCAKLLSFSTYFTKFLKFWFLLFVFFFIVFRFLCFNFPVFCFLFLFIILLLLFIFIRIFERRGFGLFRGFIGNPFCFWEKKISMRTQQKMITIPIISENRPNETFGDFRKSGLPSDFRVFGTLDKWNIGSTAS